MQLVSTVLQLYMASVTLDTVSVPTGSPICQLIHRRANERAARDVTICHPNQLDGALCLHRHLLSGSECEHLHDCGTQVVYGFNTQLHLVRLHCECGTTYSTCLMHEQPWNPQVGQVDNTTRC